MNGVKFARNLGSQNIKTAEKIEKIKIFLRAGQSYEWITKELFVSKKTVSDVKKSSHNGGLLSKSEKSEVYA